MESDPWPDQSRVGPFGPKTRSISNEVYRLAETVQRPTNWPRGRRWRWLKDDYESFSFALDVERLVPRLGATAPLPIDRSALNLRLYDLLGTYGAALPYAEPERRWLARIAADVPLRSYVYKEVEHIRQQTGELMIAGVRRDVDGNELTRRWWAWRRGIDDYAGQESVQVACDALYALSELIDPGGTEIPPPPSV